MCDGAVQRCVECKSYENGKIDQHITQELCIRMYISTHLSLSIEMKCLPSNPAKAEIDMARFTVPFLMKASAPRRTAGWLRNRRLDESIFADITVMIVGPEFDCGGLMEDLLQSAVGNERKSESAEDAEAERGSHSFVVFACVPFGAPNLFGFDGAGKIQSRLSAPHTTYLDDIKSAISHQPSAKNQASRGHRQHS